MLHSVASPDFEPRETVGGEVQRVFLTLYIITHYNNSSSTQKKNYKVNNVIAI